MWVPQERTIVRVIVTEVTLLTLVLAGLAIERDHREAREEQQCIADGGRWYESNCLPTDGRP